MPGAPAVSAVTRIGMFENVHPTEFRVAAETFLSGAIKRQKLFSSLRQHKLKASSGTRHASTARPSDRQEQHASDSALP
jgi:hypothetical protein